MSLILEATGEAKVLDIWPQTEHINKSIKTGTLTAPDVSNFLRCDAAQSVRIYLFSRCVKAH